MQPHITPEALEKLDVTRTYDADLMATSREWELPKPSDATGIDARWLQAFLALRMADLLAQVSTGVRLNRLVPRERAWLKSQAEQLVEDAVAMFQPHTGDPEYQPQDEPDGELDFDGRTDTEQHTGDGRY